MTEIDKLVESIEMVVEEFKENDDIKTDLNVLALDFMEILVMLTLVLPVAYAFFDPDKAFPVKEYTGMVLLAIVSCIWLMAAFPVALCRRVRHRCVYCGHLGGGDDECGKCGNEWRGNGGW